MDKSTQSHTAAQHLYPHLEPFAHQMLDVGDGHKVYVEQCGNPEGRAVVILHGGPGGGCGPAMRRYFNPEKWRVVLFDQRGCGRSRPHASVEANTTWHLIQDIEFIRQTLGIDTWALFGGSWGATLSLLYAQRHAKRVTNLILRGVFLMTKSELDWFYGGGAGQFWPDLWAQFTDLVPAGEQDNLIAAYSRRLFSGDHATEVRFARMWAKWENTLASMANSGPGGDSPAEYARAFARLENHYFVNRGFLPEDDHILRNMDKIAHIPGVIVQGRYDMICPPVSAKSLHSLWPGSALTIVPRAGHALSEPGISAELVRSTDALVE